MPGRSVCRRGVVARLPLAAVFAGALLLCLPLLLHAPQLPRGDDVVFAAQSTRGFAEALGEGVLYPRWVASSNTGLGAPTFVYYAPLAYYVSGLAAWALGDVLEGLRWTVVLLTVLAGLAMAACLRRHAGAVPPAAVAAAAALYVLAPYHALDLYWRFALAEYAAFVLVPLLLLFARRLLEGRGTSGVVGVAGVWAALVCTHVVTAFLAPLALAPWATLHAWGARRLGRLLPLAGAGLLGLALAGIYLVPMMVQRGEVQLEHVTATAFGDYRRNFVLRDETAHGHTRAPIKPHVNGSALAQALLAATAFGWVALRGRHGAPGTRTHDGTGRPGIDRDALALGGLAAWTTLLQLPVSEPLWRIVPELPTVQFPWRFQLFQSFAACALVARAGATAVPAGAAPAWAGTRGRALLLAAAALPSLWLSTRVLPAAGMGFGPEEAERPGARGAILFEYVPRGVPPWTEWSGLQPERGRAMLAAPGEARVLRWETHRRVVRVETPAANRLRLRTFHHPGWTARIDGDTVASGRAGPLAMLEVPVPAGAHGVEVTFEATPGERAGTALSAAALATTLGLAVADRRRRASDASRAYST